MTNNEQKIENMVSELSEVDFRLYEVLKDFEKRLQKLESKIEEWWVKQ